MNLNTLNEFRHASYTCFKQARDALFNLVDALSSETTARSFPELSLSPFFMPEVGECLRSVGRWQD